MTIRSTLLAATLALASLPAFGRNYEAQAQKAAKAPLAAITIFVDADWGGREDGAARELTRAHVAFATQGYEVISVAAYTENGDLEGFFVTYRRR